MLLRFSVSNYLSIRDRQELSMVATSLKDRDDGLIEVPGMAKTRAVPSAIVFGPNASGKSNLLLALGFMREQVLESHRKGGPDTAINRHAFALSTRCKDEPTEVEADFIVNDVRYTYGFAASDTAFEREWLYAYPHGTRRKLFERTSPSEIEFGPALKGQRQIMAELMRPNSLYLSVAAQNQHDQIVELHKYFLSLCLENKIDVSSLEFANHQKIDEIDQRAISFLKICGTGVVDFRVNKIELDNSVKDFSKKMIDALSFTIFDDNKRREFMEMEIERLHKVELAHISENQLYEFFPIERESSGTRRLLKLLRRCFGSLDSGSLMVIDEIDASLHTQICEAIVYLFADKRINTKGAQLIATTHDTNLLRSEYLRRDQIWLTEKDDQGATELFSLADIKIRAGDNFELGYLQGRYGAVPFTGPVSDLFAAH
jgi:AAA15 family ATPase/GTPase